MNSYLFIQPNPQILAVSEQLIFSIVWCFVILVITGVAIWKYQSVGQVVQLWAAMGTITGAMATYFFTREQIKEQKAQTQIFQAAYEASEKEKVNAGKQVQAVVAMLKPNASSLPEIGQAFLELADVAQNLSSTKVRVTSPPTGKPSPSVQPTGSPTAREFRDMLFRESPKPTP